MPQISDEEMDILTAINEAGDETSADKKGVGIKFLSTATGIEESKLKSMLKKLVRDSYVEHRFFSDNTDDYILREKGLEVVENL